MPDPYNTTGTVTQGQNFFQNGRNVGTVQFDARTGRRLGSGEKTNLYPLGFKASPIGTTFDAGAMSDNTSGYNLSEPTPLTGPTALAGSIEGRPQNSETIAQVDPTLKNQVETASQSYFDRLLGRKGEATLKDQAYSPEVDPAKKEVDDIQNQIRAAQLSQRRTVEEAQKNTGGATAAGVQGNVDKINRDASSHLADLSVIEQAKLANYSTAKEIADRKVAMDLEKDKNELDALKYWIDTNDTKLTKQEDRQYNEQYDMKKRELDQKEQTKKTISDLAIEAVKAGAPSDIAVQMQKAGTIDEALAIGGSYLKTPTTDVVKLDNGTTLLIDKRNGNIIKNLGGSISDVNIPSNINGTDTAPFLGAFNSAALSLSADARKSATATFNSLLKDGKTEEAKQFLLRTAVAGSPVDEQVQALGRRNALTSLQDISSLLDQAKAKGVDTGLISGGLEAVANKLGRSSNQDISYLGNQIAQTLQTYRKSMTGVAFSPAESAEYKKIFPNIGDTATLNTAKLQSLMDTFERNDRNFLAFKIGDSNYDSIFGRKGKVVLPSDRGGSGGSYDNLSNSDFFNSIGGNSTSTSNNQNNGLLGGIGNGYQPFNLNSLHF